MSFDNNNERPQVAEDAIVTQHPLYFKPELQPAPEDVELGVPRAYDQDSDPFAPSREIVMNGRTYTSHYGLVRDGLRMVGKWTWREKGKS